MSDESVKKRVICLPVHVASMANVVPRVMSTQRRQPWLAFIIHETGKNGAANEPRTEREDKGTRRQAGE